MIKETFTINEKNKDLGLLKKVRKQERLSLETRHEHSISVQDMNILFQCLILHPIINVVLSFVEIRHWTLRGL